MPGATIDHLVSLVMLISVLLTSFGLCSHMLDNAIAFQRYHQVAMKTVDLVDGMCLSPGIPSDWGIISGIPSTFGLQNLEIGGYALSPFPIMRIMDPSNTISLGGSTFFNFSMGPGAYFFLPVADHVNYSSVTRLLGVNTSYGFRLTISPTLRVSISEMPQDPLQIRVAVKGPRDGPVGKATVDATLLCASKGQAQYPSIELLTNTAETDETGSALMTFPTIDPTEDNYSIFARVNLSGLNGISYYSSIIEAESLLVPVITNYETGEVMLVHLFDITEGEDPPADALFYNMTYFVRTWNFGFRPIEIEGDSWGKVELGHSGEDFLTIPTSEPGILVIAWSGVIHGEGRVDRIVMMPWGMGAFGMQDPITFGGDPSGHEWVATELRQVTVSQISYQVKLAAWKLGM